MPNLTEIAEFLERLAKLLEAAHIATWKDFAQAIQATFTIGGIVLGAVWSYRLFVRQRLGFPRVVPEVETDVIGLDDGSTLLHAAVRLANHGTVLLRSSKAEIRLRQVVPLPAEINASIMQSYDPVLEGQAEVDWPLITRREWAWAKGDFEIEPGEIDCLHADFLVSPEVEVVEYYFFLGNAAKKGKSVGWTTTAIRSINKKEESDMADERDRPTDTEGSFRSAPTAPAKATASATAATGQAGASTASF